MLERLFGRRERNAEPGSMQLGRWGEGVAAKALKEKGYKILGQRVRFGSRKELDLVARKDDVLVFVEVKTQRDETFKRPADAIGTKKKQALRRAAMHYLRRLRQPPTYFRFDVIEVVGEQDDTEPIVRHIENAFTMPRNSRMLT